MEEIRKLPGTGVSSLLNFSLTLPPGHEMLGFEDENGVFYSVEQLKAIEWQEQHQMDLRDQPKVPDSLKQLLGELSQDFTKQDFSKPKFIRQIRQCFRYGNHIVAVANDSTIWMLTNDLHSRQASWTQMEDMSLPAIPQGEEI